MNQRDVGGKLRMGTGSAVCQQLKRLGVRRSGGSDVDVRMKRIERVLEKIKSGGENRKRLILKG